MNQLYFVVFFTISVFFTSVTFASEFTGQVVGVIDGDSLRVMHNGRAEEVRLNGVDCPEKGQAFGQRAKKATSDMAFGQKVTVHPTDIDKYGRTVAIVILPNDTNLNHELVKGGWCWWFRKYARSDNELEAFEQAAREAKIGLWIDPTPVPPWEYRKAQRGPKNSRTSVTDPVDSKSPINTGIVGNQDSKLYHRSDCPNYGKIALEHRVEFASAIEAEAAGYRLAGNCP